MVAVYIYKAVGLLCNAFMFLLVVRALSSWFLQTGSPIVNKASSICTACMEFLVAPCRRLISRFQSGGMFDWSVLLAFLVVILVRDIVQRILLQFVIM